MINNETFRKYVESVGGYSNASLILGLTVGTVKQIAYDNRRVSHVIASKIHANTKGRIKRADLRPDIYA